MKTTQVFVDRQGRFHETAHEVRCANMIALCKRITIPDPVFTGNILTDFREEVISILSEEE